MLLKEIKPGRAVDIHVRRAGYDYRLVSKVEEVKGTMVYISLISARNRVFAFRPADEVEFIYKSEDRMYIWKNVKGSVAVLDGMKVHCLNAPLNGEAYNRREAFRVYVGKETYFTRYIQKDTDISDEEIPDDLPMEEDPRYEILRFKGFVKNISENGIGIYSNEILKEGDEFSFNFKTKYGNMSCTAVVSRITQEKEGIYRNYYGCVLQEADRRLGKYLFEVQREQLKRQRG